MVDKIKTKESEKVGNQQFLSFKKVNKEFELKGKSVKALADVTFDLAEHEVNVLLGPSGCGKSTLLRMVAGLEKPTSGVIAIENIEIKGPGRDRGMVFQSYTSFPWLTVQQNVEYGLKIHGESMSLAEGTSEHFLRLVRLETFKDAYPDQISGGMRQRVALARALSIFPRLLLMDEPFGALDAETRWQMQELLLEIATREKMTVLMVTHDVEEALYLADNIVFLSKHPGRLKEVIRPKFRPKGSMITKEDLHNHPEYKRMEQHIMKLMRDEGSH